MGPTKVQIRAEIVKLSNIKSSVSRNSVFGDDNHGSIDAQIEVLLNNLSENKIHYNWDDQYVIGAAITARQWLDGDSDTTPSEDWEPIIKR